MPKSEHSILTTTLHPNQIKSVLSSVLSGATVEPLNRSPLDGHPAIAIVASQRGGMILDKSPFGPGNAVAQIIVEDNGSTRTVELIAVGDSFRDGWNRQLSASSGAAGFAALREATNLKFGRKMVAAILAALKTADPSLRPAGVIER